MRNNFKTIIVVFSPNGSTLKIGEATKLGFQEHGLECELINLTNSTWDEISNFDYSIIEDYNLIIAGFPVYTWRVIEPMEIFLSNLPTAENKYAGLFATYGRASGLALFLSGTILSKKGYTILAGAKIASTHSRIIDEENNPNPYNIFRSHPNEEDSQMMKSFANILIEELNNTKPEPISLISLKPHFSSWIMRFLSRFAEARNAVPMMPEPCFVEKECNKCGKCAKSCPLKIITLEPYPKRNAECIRCYNCIRSCPKNAIRLTLKAKVMTFIHDRIVFKNYIEEPCSKIYS